MEKTVLVLSGGSAHGAYQVGVLYNLIKKRGLKFDVIAGVSVGALNGAMIAQNKFDELWEIWQTIQHTDITKKYSTFRVLWRILVQKKRSIYELTNLYKFLEQHLSFKDLVTKLYVGTVNMDSGIYHSINNFHSDEHFRDVVYASSVQPIVWSPSEINNIPNWADGGLRNICPLSDIIDEEPDKIIIIATQPEKLKPVVSTSIWNDLDRTISLFKNEDINNDIKWLLHINDYVKQCNDNGHDLYHPISGRKLKHFEVELYRPEEELGDGLDFSREHINKCLAIGLQYGL